MKVNDYFIVAEKVLKEEKTQSGVFIPNQSREETNKARVIACADNLSEFIKAGDTVVYNPNRGVVVEEYNAVVLHKNDIYFVE